jgi:hypothetical protein
MIFFFRMVVAVYADVGGFKTVNDWKTYRLKDIFYTSSISDYYEFFEVTFDYLSPRHCTELGNCEVSDDTGDDTARQITAAVSPGQEITKVGRGSRGPKVF